MKQIKKLDPYVVIENAQLKAAEAVLTKTVDYFERKVRRWFSKSFSTPYMETFNIPWEEILLHYYESDLDNRTFNEVFDLTVENYLPEFVQEAEEEDSEFAKSLENEQKATLKKKKQREAQAKALEDATAQLVNSASNVVSKAQSLKTELDKRKKNTQPKPKSMSVKFDDEGPDDEDV